MPSDAVIHRTSFFEDAGKTLLARVLNPAGVVITQATLTGITYTVRDVTNGVARVAAGTVVVVASTVFDSLQGVSGADARWSVDLTGYNFRHEVPASAFPTASAIYRIDYLFDPTAGENFIVAWEGPCLATHAD